MAATPTSKPTPNNQAPRDTALPAGNPAIAALTTWADSVDSASSASLTNSAGLIGRLTSSADSAPTIGVAYSGGADSTALLLAAHCLWPDRVHALHIHHGLQAAADDFVRVCTLTCDRLAVPLTVLHVDARPAKGDSPEDAARQSRYAALSQAAKSAGLCGVLLGQHADDQVETLLLALSRGAGLPGLASMASKFERGSMAFYRPLLHTPAKDLRTWLVANHHPFVDDPSNTDERYTRNRIRARLLPVLAEAFPQFRQTFSRSARHAAQAQLLLNELADQDLSAIGQPPALKVLQRLSPARQANVLRHWLKKTHQAAPSTAQLAQLLKQIKACTTRGHQIDLKVAAGQVKRLGETLVYEEKFIKQG